MRALTCLLLLPEATKAGAASVLAADIETFALVAIAINAKANACMIDKAREDWLSQPPSVAFSLLPSPTASHNYLLGVIHRTSRNVLPLLHT